MPTIKPQPSRALLVIPSANCEIPFPNKVAEGILESIASTVLTFTTPKDDIQIGDIVYSYFDGFAATVVKVNSTTEIEVNAAGFVSLDNPVIVYKGGQNQGCVLYSGDKDNDDIVIETAGGDVVTLHKIDKSIFIPINVKKVISSALGANILALW